MDTPEPTGHAGRVVATLAFAGTVAAIMQTLVTPLIAELPTILHTSSSNAAWVITVTLLVSAVCVPVTGRLGDMIGKRRMILVCTVPLMAGSADLVPISVRRTNPEGGETGWGLVTADE
ncbi:MFS transporter, partial [Streptomyces sp. NPDC005921]